MLLPGGVISAFLSKPANPFAESNLSVVSVPAVLFVPSVLVKRTVQQLSAMVVTEREKEVDAGLSPVFDASG